MMMTQSMSPKQLQKAIIDQGDLRLKQITYQSDSNRPSMSIKTPMMAYAQDQFIGSNRNSDGQVKQSFKLNPISPESTLSM